MIRILTGALVALSVVAAPVAASDLTQLAAAAGVSAEAAQGMSLTALAALKFNRDGHDGDRQRVGPARAPVMVDGARHAQLIAAAGLTPAEAEGLTLAALAAAKHNASGRTDEQVGVVVMSSRGPVRVGSQLVAAAGLDDVAAQGMSLTAIAAAKFNRDSDGRNQQTVR